MPMKPPTLDALNAIADWCDRFTPLVALDPPHGLFLDITGCVHLFGGEAAMMRLMCDALTAQGFAVSAAIAGTAGMRADADPSCPWPHRRRRRGSRCGHAAAGVRARRRRCRSSRGLRRAGLKTIGDVACPRAA